MHLLTRLAFDRMQAGILLFLGEYLVDADPTAAGRREALAAATSLCPVSINNGSQLTNDLQAAVSGQVLTCNNSRSAFLDAIALYKPSGYPKDTELVPAFVVEPVGAYAVCCDLSGYI